MLALNELPPIAFSNQVLLIENSIYLISRRRLDKSRATKSSVKVAPSERRREKMKLREESSQAGQGKKFRIFFFLDGFNAFRMSWFGRGFLFTRTFHSVREHGV